MGKSDAVVRAHVWVSGRVQGIFYRACAKAQAEKRNIAGWVQNIPDGRVELVAQGKKSDVEDFVDWCKIGPPLARVEKVEVLFEKPQIGVKGFELIDYVRGMMQAVKTRFSIKTRFSKIK